MPKYCIVANHAYFHTYENEWADSTTPSYVGDLFLGEVEANSPEEAIESVVRGNDYFYADYLTAYKVSKATKGKTPVYFGHIAQDGVIMLRHKDLSGRSENHPYALIRDATEFIQAGSIPDPKIVIDLKDAEITVEELRRMLDPKDVDYPEDLPSYWWKKYISDVINPPNRKLAAEIARWKLLQI